MNLTVNYNELCKSETATRLHLDNDFRNRSNASEIETNLIELWNNIIVPLRVQYGGEWWITSGYRSPAVNAAVGGVATSQHVKGQAIDFTCINREMLKAMYWHIHQNLEFDQMIFYRSRGFIHISYNSERNRHFIFIKK